MTALQFVVNEQITLRSLDDEHAAQLFALVDATGLALCRKA